MIYEQFFTADERAALDEALDFEQIDELEAERADRSREVLTGLPARPGTIR